MKIFNNHTLLYYQENAASFIKGTFTVDMEDAQTRFLKHLPAHTRILDFGCGSGRDTIAFLKQGYLVDALDGSEEICRKATELTGIPVRHLLFQELDAEDRYDGIWACASILHLPKTELSDVLHRIAIALKEGGIFYTSFKYGTYEGMRNGRYFTDFTEETFDDFMKKIPSLQIIESWITRNDRPGREEERWINILARRVSK